MAVTIVKQSDRVCSACGKPFLSGLLHVERQYLTSALCLDCAKEDSTLARFRRLTKNTWARIKGDRDANRT